MKRANYLVIIALLAAFTSCESKDNDDNDYYDSMQLLETIIRSDGSIYRKFEYDNQSRITRVLTCPYPEDDFEYVSTFTYSGDDLVKVVSDEFYDHGNGDYTFNKDGYEVEFIKSENKITITEKYNRLPDEVYTRILDLDSNGYPSEMPSGMSERSYSIVNGNLANYTRSSFTSMGGGSTTGNSYSYKYDNKKSLFYNCKTPGWYLIYAFEELGSKTNVTEINNFRIYWAYTTTTKIEYEYDSAGFPIKKTEINDTDTTVTMFKYK